MVLDDDDDDEIFWIHMLFGDDDENLHEFIGFFLEDDARFKR